MNLTVKKGDLIWDGMLPREWMAADRYREVFCCAQPLLEHAFKVERPAYIRVWWFDRYLENVVDFAVTGKWPKPGEFFTIDCLRSAADQVIGGYLSELGWQVRVTVKSIERREYAVLAIFSPEGSILMEDEAYRLKSLTEEAPFPAEDWPAWQRPVSNPGYAVVGA